MTTRRDNPDHQSVLDQLFDAVYFVDLDKRITYWNRAAENLTGYSAEEVLGHRCQDNILRHIDCKGNELCVRGCPLTATMQDGLSRTADVFLHHKDGHRVPILVRATAIRDAQGDVIGAAEVFNDNRDKRHLEEKVEELEKQALMDHLTGIPNRRYMQTRMEARIQEFRLSRSPFGLLFLDIDHFKKINDEHGHEIGDQVLRMVAQTLMVNCRAYDTVGRWGGEEFLVIVAAAADEQLSTMAERYRVLVAKSGLKQPKTIRATVSIGATRVDEADTLESLLERVDTALYRAKSEGRNRVSLLSQ